jgi:hypothetical protein
MQISRFIGFNMSDRNFEILSSSNIKVSGIFASTFDGRSRSTNLSKKSEMSPVKVPGCGWSCSPAGFAAWNQVCAAPTSILRVAIFFKKNVCKKSTVS